VYSKYIGRKPKSDKRRNEQMAKGIATKTYNKVDLTSRIEMYLGERITKQTQKRWITDAGVEISILGSNDFLVEFETEYVRFFNLADLKESVIKVSSN
jgi:hypothetical protein